MLLPVPTKIQSGPDPLVMWNFLGFPCHCVWVGPCAAWPHGGEPSSLAHVRTSEHPGCSQTQGERRSPASALLLLQPDLSSKSILEWPFPVRVSSPGGARGKQSPAWKLGGQWPASFSFSLSAARPSPWPCTALFSWGARYSRELALIAPMCSFLCTFLPSCGSLPGS